MTAYIKNVLKIKFLTWKVRVFRVRVIVRQIILAVASLVKFVQNFRFSAMSDGLWAVSSKLKAQSPQLKAVSLHNIPSLFTIQRLKLSVIVAVLFTMTVGMWVWGGRVRGELTTEEIEARETEARNTGLYKWVAEDTGMIPTIVRGATDELIGKPQYVQDQEGVAQGVEDSGALGSLLDGVTFLYAQRPVSTSQYVAHKKEQMGFVREVHAQNSRGYNALDPISALWSTFKNVSYIFFVIIFVVMGFMILFRTKIGGQIEVTLMNSIPRIILSLILVTFSYAIVGALIDIGGTLPTYAIAYVLGGQDGHGLGGADAAAGVTLVGEIEKPPDPAKPTNIFSLIIPFLEAQVGGAGGTWVDNFTNSLNTVVKQIPGVKALPNFFAEGLARFVLAMALVGIIFKVFFALLGAYAGIVMKTIIAPLQLLVTALPGNQSAMNWLKSILSDVLVFPVTFAMLALAAIIIYSSPGGSAVEPWNINPDYTRVGKFEWSPAPLGQFTATDDKGNVIASGSQLIGPLLALGILFMVPGVPQIIKSLLQVEELPVAAQAGETLRGAAAKVPIIGGFIG